MTPLKKIEYGEELLGKGRVETRETFSWWEGGRREGGIEIHQNQIKNTAMGEHRRVSKIR